MRDLAPRLGEHAIVVGASIAGLLAARALSDSFDRVTVLDRDTLPDAVDENRRAIPQGHHVHGMQPAGEDAVERLLPGFRAGAIRAGAVTAQTATEMRIRFAGHRLPRVHLDSDATICSRALLEGTIRRRVGMITNVDILDRHNVVALISVDGRVTGVETHDRAVGGGARTLHAELVVAACGRGARVPAWLESIGYERPREERVDVEILYASRHLRLPLGALGNDKAVYDSPRVGRPRGMAMLLEEGDRWTVGLYGYGAAQHPPTDDAGWYAFAATVAEPEVLAAIEQAEPLDRIVTHAFPANVRRRYERLKRFPAGLLVTGDALCSFNPIYAQGMTIAALQALALQECLRHGDRQLARRYFKAVRIPVDWAWRLATAADVSLPEVHARGALPVRAANRYVECLLRVAEHDEVLARTIFEVAGMLAAPTRLLRPATALRALRGSIRLGDRSGTAY